METKKAEYHTVNYGTHVLVWLALLVLLALTIAAAGMGLGAFNILAVLVIAGVKSALVLLFFMHLRYEGFLLRSIFLASVGVLVIVVALTFLEVIFR